MKKVKKFGIASTLILLVVVTQTLLYGIFVAALLRGSRSAMEKSEEETFARLGEAIESSFRDELEFASFVIIPLTQDKQIQDSLFANDADTLEAHVLPLYEKMQDRLTGFHFHRVDGTSLLRIPAAEVGNGAESRSVRPLILDCLESRSVCTGIDHGERGTSFRAVAPVMAGDSIAGVVEVSFDFSAPFVTRLSARHDGDFFLYYFDREGKPYYHAGSRNSDRCSLAEASAERLMSGERV